MKLSPCPILVIGVEIAITTMASSINVHELVAPSLCRIRHALSDGCQAMLPKLAASALVPKDAQAGRKVSCRAGSPLRPFFVLRIHQDDVTIVLIASAPLLVHHNKYEHRMWACCYPESFGAASARPGSGTTCIAARSFTNSGLARFLLERQRCSPCRQCS